MRRTVEEYGHINRKKIGRGVGMRLIGRGMLPENENRVGEKTEEEAKFCVIISWNKVH